MRRPADVGGSPAGVEARDVTVVRGGRVILRGVSIAVARGEVLGVLGPSGAGKSTFFGAIAGEETVARGCVLLGGRDVTHLPLWQRARLGLGYVPQSPSVLLSMTVAENLQTFLTITRARDAGTDAVRAAADQVGLGGRLHVTASALSGGERRRLEVARALAGRPRVLICDEPFAGVDPQGAAHLGALLREVADGGVAVLLADHHVEEALRVCTLAVLLLDGVVATSGEPEAFRNDPLVRGRYLGTWHPEEPRG